MDPSTQSHKANLLALPGGTSAGLMLVVNKLKELITNWPVALIFFMFRKSSGSFTHLNLHFLIKTNLEYIHVFTSAREIKCVYV